ncbi:hypothetical protein [Neisseria animalis]|uniref:hypothetical protein n=1 Tax=Neisseria animalis TaxID=492 RepID=UPI000F6EDBF8|nr:hypothetical protein [Neisseria animalis]VEE06946.1 outer membrane protein OmpU [Neisseria animalis]
MMYRCPIFLLSCIFSTAVYADVEPEVLHVPTPVFFDTPSSEILPANPLSNNYRPNETLYPSNKIIHGNILETKVNQAIIDKNWQALPLLLEHYALLPNHDEILYQYALGALYRSQLRHDEAIALYRNILKKYPKLLYPRFDLAVMLFENKQYIEANEEFQHILPLLPSHMQKITEQYINSINTAQNWQPDIRYNIKQQAM